MTDLPLVFLPGLLCDKRLFKTQIEAFNKLTITQFINLNAATSIEQMAKLTLKHAPKEFGLVGFSMGGYVAFEILRQNPNAVKKLALISTTARLDTPEMRQRRKDFITLAKRGKFRGITRQLLPQMIAPSRLQDHELTQEIIKMGRDSEAQTFINQETAILGRQESLKLLPKIECPTYIIAGQQDLVTPPECQTTMCRLIPDAHLYLLENTGHMLPMEQPEKSTTLLRNWYLGEQV